MTQRTPRLLARETTANTKQLMKGVCQRISAKRAPSAADAVVHRGSGVTLNSLMIVGVGTYVVKVWTDPLDRNWMKRFRFRFHFMKTAVLDKYDQFSPFLDFVIFLHDHHAHLFVSEKVMLYHPQNGVEITEREKNVSIKNVWCKGYCEGDVRASGEDVISKNWEC